MRRLGHEPTTNTPSIASIYTFSEIIRSHLASINTYLHIIMPITSILFVCVCRAYIQGHSFHCKHNIILTNGLNKRKKINKGQKMANKLTMCQYCALDMHETQPPQWFSYENFCNPQIFYKPLSNQVFGLKRPPILCIQSKWQQSSTDHNLLYIFMVEFINFTYYLQDCCLVLLYLLYVSPTTNDQMVDVLSDMTRTACLTIQPDL